MNFNGLNNQQLRELIARERMLRELNELQQNNRSNNEYVPGTSLVYMIIGMFIMGLFWMNSLSVQVEPVNETSTIEEVR